MAEWRENRRDFPEQDCGGFGCSCVCFVSDVAWLSGERIGETFLSRIAEDDTIQDLVSQIHSVVDGKNILKSRKFVDAIKLLIM